MRRAKLRFLTSRTFSIVSESPVVEFYALSAVGVYEPQWVVSNVAVQIPALWVMFVLIRKGRVWTRESSLCSTEVSRAKEVQPRFLIPFFAGEFLW
jgi:hypothetical protein